MKHFEFWHPRVFEAPYYAWLAMLCLRHGLSVRSLAKANYALDHGEIGIGSKLATQLAFDQQYFLPSELLTGTQSADEKALQIQAFIQAHGSPAIIKPDMGCVGKGVRKVFDNAELPAIAAQLQQDHILQKYCDLDQEYGVFYIRSQGEHRITGINQKHFPSVVGDSKRSLRELAEAHPRFTRHWDLFLQYLDTSVVPAKGQAVRLSFVGSHTMGCKFTNDSHLASDAVYRRIGELAEGQPGFNFGRLDVRAACRDAFLDGEFVIIEVNGVASLPTHMFDPNHSLLEAYRILLAHAGHLARIAAEHRGQSMQLLPTRTIWQRVKENQQQLNRIHDVTLAGV